MTTGAYINSVAFSLYDSVSDIYSYLVLQLAVSIQQTMFWLIPPFMLQILLTNFISISNNFTFNFNKLLENHQIKIKRYMSGGYIKSFFDKKLTESLELFVMANKLNEGLNKNEVQLVSKSKENKGCKSINSPTTI